MNYIRIGDMTFTDLDTFEVYNRKTGLLDYTLDDLQNITIEGSQEKSPITGKGGRTIGYKNTIHNLSIQQSARKKGKGCEKYHLTK